MELWIRSQNKEYLVDARELAYAENFAIPCVLAFVRNTSKILGRYQTKERALEVLDEIQEHLNRLLSEPEDRPVYPVYEMPE